MVRVAGSIPATGTIPNNLIIGRNKKEIIMDQASQLKVIAAGFSIIRTDDQPSPRIKIKDKTHTEWATLRKFATKAERDREFKQLMQLSTIIND